MVKNGKYLTIIQGEALKYSNKKFFFFSASHVYYRMVPSSWLYIMVSCASWPFHMLTYSRNDFSIRSHKIHAACDKLSQNVPKTALL